MSLVSILGHPEATSLVSVAYADDYAAGKVWTASWTALSTAVKEAALRQASEMVQGHPCLVGTPVVDKYCAPYIQRFNFPLAGDGYLTGTADSGNAGKTTLVDATLADTDVYRTDHFLVKTGSTVLLPGALLIYEGTNAGEIRDLSAFAPSTGTITVSTAFSSQIDTTSDYMLIYPLPRPVAESVVEQAAYLVLDTDGRQRQEQAQHQGVSSIQQGGATATLHAKTVHLCVQSETLLAPWLKRSLSGRIVR